MLTDGQLLEQCEVDAYRASGPGGQKRNKTSSAIRLRHRPSGLRVIAEESRSQHENRARALRRLRQALYLLIREPFSEEGPLPGELPARCKDLRFWPIAGLALDVLQARQGRVSETAQALGSSTGKLVAFLRLQPRVWQQANLIRSRFGHKPLVD
jgi:hypothetical protein